MNKIVLSALGLLAARSPRLRKFAPAVPLLVAAYGLWNKYKASAAVQPRLATAPAR
jgi:hypothetical protein